MREWIIRLTTAGVAAAAWLLVGGAALGDEIRYLAWDDQEARAVLRLASGTQSVVLGDGVPGFGTVVVLDESHVVLQRVLSEAERTELESRGFIGHWAEEVEVVREDLRFQGIPMPPPNP